MNKEIKQIERYKLIECMMENKDGDGEICIVENNEGELEVVFFNYGWINTYCSQTQCDLIEKFGFCPGDSEYSDDNEETEFTEEDAESYLDDGLEFCEII